MENIFFETTVILCLSAILSIIFRYLKQPVILAYILTGILIGPLAHVNIQNQASFKMMGQFGVTFLLFILGLEMQLKELRSIGVTALVVGLLQIFLTLFLGIDVSLFLGLTLPSALYIAVALTFSSTIIIVTLLSNKKDLRSLYGKISVGVLLVQDFFAIFVLMILSGFSNTATTFSSALSLEQLFFVVLKAFIIFSIALILGKTIFPKIIHSIASSQELLLLFSLAWMFGFASFVSSPLVGFPLEIGGFLAGITLASSYENLQIAARVRPLRDFFITIFFVILGMKMSVSDLGDIVLPVLVLCLFVIIIKPLIVTSIMAVLRYRKRTSFLTSLNFAQVSEFSLIIVFLGGNLGQIPSKTVSIITIVAITTFTISTYMILHGNRLYAFAKRYLAFFELKHTREGRHDASFDVLDSLVDHVALIGAHRMGESILESLVNDGENVVVVDFDPDVIAALKERGIPCLFGDIADMEIQERVSLKQARLVVSTVPDVEDNLVLIRSLVHANKKIKIVVIGQDAYDAKRLYKAGADYVAIPGVIGGRHLAKMIKDDLANIAAIREKEIKILPDV